MRRSLLISAGLLLFLAAPLRAADDCSPAAFERAAAHAKQIQKQLMAVKVGEMDPAVSGSTQERIRAFKDALVSAADLIVGCQHSEEIDPGALGASLNTLLGEGEKASQGSNEPSPGKPSAESTDIFGANVKAEARISGDEPGVLGITISFGIPCSYDEMLLIYQWQERAWRKRLRWQSSDYDSIGDAFGDFFTYVILPGDRAENWRVAVAHGHPWCTSRWSGFDLDLLRPGADPGKPEIMAHGRHGYTRDSESPKEGILKRIPGRGDPDSFELRLHGGMLDMDIMTKAIIYRYQLTADGARRVQPVAMNGRDFVDEWLQRDWTEAGDWSDPANAASLHEEHETFAKLLDHKRTPNRPSITYGAVRGCSGDPTKFQVEVLLDPGAPHYFAIRQGKNSFLMLSAANQPNALCKGPDLMKKRE